MLKHKLLWMTESLRSPLSSKVLLCVFQFGVQNQVVHPSFQGTVFWWDTVGVVERKMKKEKWKKERIKQTTKYLKIKSEAERRGYKMIRVSSPLPSFFSLEKNYCILSTVFLILSTLDSECANSLKAYAIKTFPRWLL